MVLGLKLHLPTHHISQNPFLNPNRTPKTTLNPLFRFKPIETHSFPQLHHKLRIKNPNGFKSEQSNSNGGGGGGGGADDLTKDGDDDGDRDGDEDEDEDERGGVYLRSSEFLLRSDWQNVGVLGLSGTMAWACAQVARLMYLAIVEICQVILQYVLVGVGVVFVVGVALLRFWWF